MRPKEKEMKRLVSYSLLIVMTVMCLSAANDSKVARNGDLPFRKSLMGALSAYKATEEPDLSEYREKKIERIKRRATSAPGRMAVPRHIIVDKPHTTVRVVNALGDLLVTAPCCPARNLGPKRRADDCRTPEGTFPLYGIYDSTNWRYKNQGNPCYGPWFLYWKSGFLGIGLHGTNSPGSVPGRHSHGCVRMHNGDIVKVKSLTQRDSRIISLPDGKNG